MARIRQASGQNYDGNRQNVLRVLPGMVWPSVKTWELPQANATDQLRGQIRDYFERHIERLIVGQGAPEAVVRG
jgi:hypothetical protein